MVGVKTEEMGEKVCGESGFGCLVLGVVWVSDSDDVLPCKLWSKVAYR